MTCAPGWWKKPRKVTVVVDNASWIEPYAKILVGKIAEAGEHARLCRSHNEIAVGDVAFYLGCLRRTPPEVLARHRCNLVVHESDLPKGRGFSPLTWQVLEGRNIIPICLLEAADEVDAGPVIYREALCFNGHELIDEMRAEQGRATVDLCIRFLNEAEPPRGEPQSGEASYYTRRRPVDSQLDPDGTIAEQFDLLRVVDNERYPAFFDYRGKRYKLSIEKIDSENP